MAQTVDLSGTGGPPPITISLLPANPQPYGTAVLSVASNILDLANSTLVVSVAGKQVYKGNVQPVAITLGAPGSTNTTKATVTSGGQSYSQSLSVTPGDVSLVEEPISSAPPLYAGKPLVPISGQVRLVAITNFRTAGGSPINPANLSYSWSKDGSILGTASGIGKNTVIVSAPLQYRSSNISVTVSTQDTSEIGSATVSLAPQTPTVRVYANDPLLGIRFEHALGGSFAITDTEASFYAAPYSLSTTGAPPAISWFLNGSLAGSDTAITLRPTGSGGGNSSLTLSAKDSAGYGSATTNLSLTFGTKSSNLFGL